MKYQSHLTLVSKNKKVEPIPVSTTTADTCPVDCPFNHANNGGCYAEFGPLALHWRMVTMETRGMNFDEFVKDINDLPAGQLWRHNQAGDLPGDGVKLDRDACKKLTKANTGKRGFTYTHYNPNKATNGATIQAMNKNGFTVNLSGNNVQHALKLAKLDVGPVVTVTNSEINGTFKAGGKKFVQCPATMENVKIDCAQCKLCAVPTRKSIVYFPAHGTGKRYVNEQNKKG